MTMYAIKDNEDKTYYNFEEDSFTNFTEECLLPTATMAIEYYDQYIGGDQNIMEIKIIEFKDGVIDLYSEKVIPFVD